MYNNNTIKYFLYSITFVIECFLYSITKVIEYRNSGFNGLYIKLLHIKCLKFSLTVVNFKLLFNF